MNQFFQQAVDFFAQLDKKQMQQVLAASIVGAVLIFFGFVYMQYRQVNFFKREMVKVNDARLSIKEILNHYEALKKEQKRGEAILARDKNFKLREYVDTTVEKLGLKLTKEQLSEGDIEHAQVQNFIEIKMDMELSGINTKQLVDLMSALEHDERVTIRRVVLTKKNQDIDVQMIISTLRQKAEAPPAFEND